MAKRALKFGNYSTASDGWTLSALSLTYPERRSNYVEIPCCDGEIDLSIVLGDEPKYTTRELTATLELSIGTRSQRDAIIRKLVNTYHGRDIQITLPDDADHTLTGRLYISVQYSTPAHAAIDIRAICQPWLIATASKLVVIDATEAAVSVQLPNAGSRREVPTITVSGSGDITITNDNDTWTISPGTYILPDICVPPGGATYIISGVGQIKFSYEEAIL